MKLEAVKGRGRRRDFYDIYTLLDKFELSRMMELNRKKYGQDSRFLILKSLVCFEDAEQDTPISMLQQDVDWDEVKETISEAVGKIG